jgi:signal peptidase II
LIRFFRVYGYLATIAGLILIVDQWTKAIVRKNLSFTDSWTPAPWLEPYFRIVHWKNTGAAFGIFQELSLVFTVLAIVVSVVIIYYFPRISLQEWPLRLAMSFQLGGALGNLIDRLAHGYVIDFIALLPSWNMPVFNVADASITAGVIILIVGVWIKERSEKKQGVQETDKKEPDRVKSTLPEEPCGE